MRAARVRAQSSSVGCGPVTNVPLGFEPYQPDSTRRRCASAASMNRGASACMKTPQVASNEGKPINDVAQIRPTRADSELSFHVSGSVHTGLASLASSAAALTGRPHARPLRRLGRFDPRHATVDHQSVALAAAFLALDSVADSGRIATLAGRRKLIRHFAPFDVSIARPIVG